MAKKKTTRPRPRVPDEQAEALEAELGAAIEEGERGVREAPVLWSAKRPDKKGEHERRMFELEGADAVRRFAQAVHTRGEVLDEELRAFMASRVRLARRALYVSQAELAAWVGVTEQNVQHVERGRQFPSHRLLWLLVNELPRLAGWSNWTMDWFYGADVAEQVDRLAREAHLDEDPDAER